MTTSLGDQATILVVPVPPRGPWVASVSEVDLPAIPIELAWRSRANAASGFESITRPALEGLRDSLLGLEEGTYMLQPRSDPRAVEHLTHWHERHRFLAYLDISAEVHAPSTTPLDVRMAGTTRWIPPSAFRYVTLPSVGELLENLSGPRELILSGVIAVLGLPPSEQAVLGSHALLAGLGRAGGVVITTRKPDAAANSTTTLSQDSSIDPAERLAAYRPAQWRRLQQEPGYSVVVEADGASTSALSSTVDGFLSGSRCDIEIAVRGRREQQEHLARRYAEEPRFLSLDGLRMGPRVLLVRGTSAPTRETLAELARIHEIHAAGLVLVVHAGDAGRLCGASYEAGAWARGMAVLREQEEMRPPTMEHLRRVLEPRYRTWWSSADEVGMHRHGGGNAPSDLLDGTSAPERWVLSELEKQQQLVASSRSELREAKREIERLRQRPTQRVGRAIRRRLRQ